MAKAYEHQRRQRTQRRLKNQSFMEFIETTAHGKAEEIVHSLSTRETLTISSKDQNIRTFCC
jgi:hypothetical protein